MRCALVIASDAARGRDLAIRMRERGFRPLIARDASGGVAEARLQAPDVVIIDPQGDEPSGANTARAISGVAPRASLFVVASDPTEPRLLRAVPVAAEPAPAPPPAPAVPPRVLGRRVVLGDLVIDPGAASARVGDRDVGLTRMEYLLLHALASAGGDTLTRDEIHVRVWGEPLRAGSRSVDVLVRRLRRKVDERGGAFTFVQTVPGEGYRLLAQARTLSA